MPDPASTRLPATSSVTRALELVEPGHTLAVGGSNAEPTLLVEELCAQSARLSGVKAWTWPGGFATALTDPALLGHVELRLSVPNRRTADALARGQAQYVPGHVSMMLKRIADGDEQIDGALVMVAPPDADGWCSLGTSVVNMKPACEAAGFVIAQVNDQMPRTRGDSAIHISRIDAAVTRSQPLPELERPVPSDLDRAIAAHAARLIEHGSTIQCGIGALPDAVLRALHGHRDLRIRSGIIGDGILGLAASGALRAGGNDVSAPILTGSVLGTRALYDFVDDNPLVELYDGRVTHDVRAIAACRRFVAINSVIEIDLTGQVNAEQIGGRLVAGVGGQSDFVRGAQLSDGGRNILVLPSTTRDRTRSRIVPRLAEGTPVSLPRSDVEWVVTEHGAVSLAGLSVHDRAEALISVADPAHARELTRLIPAATAGAPT